MFLLIRFHANRLEIHHQNLHSTMFLLIRILQVVCGCQYRMYLHSTMFLLILSKAKSETALYQNLHSTMFLLIRRCWWIDGVCYEYLHSTMFLLILLVVFIDLPPQVNLHSTMFLLIRIFSNSLRNVSDIYIPQCFY